jgi:predicted ATP-grasp superfamily ATP-dependent carboligase
MILDVAKQLGAKEIISLEGVGSPIMKNDSKIYYHTNKESLRGKIENIKIEPMKEGIVMGITSALMVMAKENKPLTCFFAETRSSMPDSKASAKIIEILDRYLGLKVDYKPLMKQAEKFEGKLKEILQKGLEAKKQIDKKDISYVG